MYTLKQKYLLSTSAVRVLLWASVNLRLFVLYPLTGSRFLPGGIADFYLTVSILTILLNLPDYIFVFKNSRLKPDPITSIIQFAERSLVTFVLMNNPKIAKNDAFGLMILSESILETIKYIYCFMKVFTYNRVSKFLKFIKELAVLILSPVQVCCEMYLISLSLSLTDNIWIKVLLIIYLPVFYSIYKSKILKLVKTKGSGGKEKTN